MLFAPAEDTFDHLAALLRLIVTPMPCATINRASSPLAGFGRALVLRHMRCDADGTQVFDMVVRVIGLVGADRNTMTNGFAFGFQTSACEARRSAVPSAFVTVPAAGKSVPVFHGHVARVAELRLPPSRLAIRRLSRIGCARMRHVRALLAAKIPAKRAAPSSLAHVT